MNRRTCFLPGQPWLDDRGVPINAHGGGVMHHDGTYYWHGQHMVEGEIGNTAQVGVHVYASEDLYNWRDAGVALAVVEEAGHPIERGCILERPKVVRSGVTGRFVMWFHLEPKGMGYLGAQVGVAEAERPEGPFRFVRAFRLNAGHWPLNVTAEQKAALANEPLMARLKARRFTGGPDEELPSLPVLARDYAGGQMSRDMTLFVDDDGSVYHVTASEENSTLHVSLLTDDLLDTTGRYVRVLEHRWHEAPAVWRQEGRYWLLSSHCTGWAPNEARLSVADAIWGPWTEVGNPCEGVDPATGLGPEKTFGGQSTCVFPVVGRPGEYVAMFDVWRPSNAIEGGHVWLPVVMREGAPRVAWRDAWRLGEGSVAV